jgi:hypothetical protein
MTLLQTTNHRLGGWPSHIGRLQQRPQIPFTAGSWLPPAPHDCPAIASQHAGAVAGAATMAADQLRGREVITDATLEWQRGSSGGGPQQQTPMISRRRMLLHAGTLAAAPGMCACCPGVAVAAEAWSYGANRGSPEGQPLFTLAICQ